MAYICTTNEFWCTAQQKKVVTADRRYCKKSSWWWVSATLNFLCKKTFLSHIQFCFLSIYLSQKDSIFFFCFHEVSDFLQGLKVHLIVDFSFFVVGFSTENTQEITSFFAILLHHCLEEQSRPYAVDYWRATSFPVKKIKFLLPFLCCIFWLDLMNHFLIKNSQFSFAFFHYLAWHHVIKVLIWKEKLVLMFSWCARCPSDGGHHGGSKRLIAAEMIFFCSLWY